MADFELAIDLNLRTVLLTTEAAIPEMRARGGGDVIARAYLAAVMPDFRYRQTTATLDVCGYAFRAAGRQPIDLGWRAAFPDWQPADEKGDDAQLLPALRNGEIAHLENPTIEDKETRPPPRYTKAL
jgi:DNA topoisomerase-3